MTAHTVRRILFLGGLCVAHGCTDGDAAARPGSAAPRAPEQVIVAVDLSGSQSAGRLADGRQAYRGVVDALDFGDRIVLLQVHQRGAQEEGARRWAETVPAPDAGHAANSLDREKAARVRTAAHTVAAQFFEDDAAGSLPTTDLFATLHIAAEYVRSAGSRHTTLVLLSDMLQSADGIEMARAGGVPDAAWVETRQTEGVVPRLDGVCVVVVGADATTAHGVAVRAFWQAYFQAAGATLRPEAYRLIAAGGVDGCR